MARWDKEHNIDGELIAPEQKTAKLEQTVAKLEKVIQGLEEKLNRYTPRTKKDAQQVSQLLTSGKTLTQTIHRSPLPELDDYIEKYKASIRTDITKKRTRHSIPYLYPRPKPNFNGLSDDPKGAHLSYAQALREWEDEYKEANGPTYNPTAQGHITLGVYKETITLNTSKPKKAYHLLAKALKAEVPNYRNDARFSHIQNTKIEYDKRTISVRCAVFEWE
jgi:hypothetical protein